MHRTNAIQIARALRQAQDANENAAQIAMRLSRLFKTDNPDFDEDQFRAAFNRPGTIGLRHQTTPRVY